LIATRADLARESLREEFHRQTQNVPEEFSARSSACLSFSKCFVGARSEWLDQNCGGHRQKQRVQPVIEPPTRMLSM
jgi:hypothetical protein